MTNELGVDYYRVVTEGEIGSWSQVYAKMPLDKEELIANGGVLGVVRLSGKADFLNKGVELMEEIDVFVTSAANKGNVSGLIEVLNKYKAEGCFGWVDLNEERERVIKVGGVGAVRAIILRKGKSTTLRQSGASGAVMGRIVTGDRLVIGTEKAVLAAENVGVGGANLTELVEKITAEIAGNSESQSESAMIMEVGSYEDKNLGIYEDTKIVEEKTIPPERLVSNRIVGISGWRSLREKLRQGLPLKRFDKQKRHRWILFLGAIFLVALILSVGLGLVKAKNDRASADFKAVYEPWEQKRKEAEGLYSLNPVGARELLRAVRDDLASKKGRFAGGPFEGKINDFSKLLDLTWTKVSGEMTVQPELFFNLGLIRTNLNGSRLAYNGKELLVLDQGLGTVAKVDYSSQKSSVVLGKGEGQNWSDLTGFKTNLIVLKNGGLVVSLSDKRADVSFDASVTQPVAIEIFGEAAYLLDKGANEIWRYGLSGGVVGDRRGWLALGVKADLSQGVDLAIDGDVFALVEGGKVLRLRRGQVEKYSLGDVPDDFNPDRIAVAADVDVLALLDSKKSRVVFFNKETGAYMKQLKADEFSKAKDLVLIDQNTLVVLEEGKLVKVGL